MYDDDLLLAPAAATLRILPLADVTANYLFIWIRRLVGFSVLGLFFAEAALLLGLPAGGYAVLLGLLGLVITGLAVVFLLQNRAPVAAWIRGEGKAKKAGRQGAERRGAGGLRDRFADIWHVLAVIYVAAIFSVWVLGIEGDVESLSIRTIRLRDPAGSVHTVPFSDVGTVLNYTKDFSNVVLNIGVAYRENVDEVMEVIEDLGREMLKDPTLGPDIITPLVAQGVQSLDDSAVVIRAKMRVTAGTQRGMKREFNHRMKNRFDELGIEIPFPQTAITFGADKQGNAVAGRMVVEDERAVAQPAVQLPGQPPAEGKAPAVRDRRDAPDGDGGDGGH